MGYIGWVDLETTGSDEKSGAIIEWGWVVTTDLYPFEELGRYAAVIKPSASDWWSMVDDPVVQEMHTVNGLRVDVDNFGVPLTVAERDLLDWLGELDVLRDEDDHRPYLGGSGASHFDRRWLRVHVPAVERCFTYATVDVGVLRRTLRMAGLRSVLDAFRDVHPVEGRPHRGLDDIVDHVEEMRYYTSLIKEIPHD